MRKILSILLLLSLLTFGCSPINQLRSTGVVQFNSIDYTFFHDNDIKVFTGQYDLTKYIELEYIELDYTADIKTLRFKDTISGNYFKTYRLNSVMLCEEKRQTVLDKMNRHIIKYVKGGSAILNLKVTTRQVQSHAYYSLGPSPLEIYTTYYCYSFTILKSNSN